MKEHINQSEGIIGARTDSSNYTERGLTRIQENNIHDQDDDNNKFFDFLNVNNHSWFKSAVYRCVTQIDGKYCHFQVLTKDIQEHKESFVELA
jgi:hypothetical protein